MTTNTTVKPTRKRATAAAEIDFKSLQLRVSATDSMDTAIDTNGVLRPGRFISPESLVREVNRLLADGYQLLAVTPAGQEKLGANVTGVNVKILMARGGKFKAQKRFSFLLIAENPTTMNHLKTELKTRYEQGFSLFGEPKSLAFSRDGVNMWYTFIK